jgi:hypothetical protein
MNNFYIYIYLDQRKSGRYCYNDVCFLFEPIYVGKGKNKRIKNINGRNPFFKNKINKIKNLELEPIVFKLFENLSEKVSFELEEKLIKEIGRIDLGTGPLLNMTDGGEGTSGHIVSEETKELIAEKQRKWFLEIEKEFKKRNYILLTTKEEYKNCDTKLKYICPEGHESSISWDSFRRGTNCQICSYGKRKGKNNSFFGKRHSKETKMKMSEIRKEKYKNGELNFKGNDSQNHKLTEEQVIQIKLLLKEGILKLREIADMFGVSIMTISNIKTGRNWSYIKLENI